MDKKTSINKIAIAVITNQYEQVLLLKKNNTWMLPGGHIENNDDPEFVIFQKTFKETGINITNFVLFLDEKIYNEQKKQNYRYKIFKGTYRGTKMPSISPYEGYKGLQEIRWFSHEIASTKLKLTEITKIGINN